MGDLPAWVNLVNGIGALGVTFIVLWLWLNGVLVRGKDVEVRLKERDDSHAREVELIQSAHGDSVTALNLSHDNRVRMLTARLDAVVADRDAWREASQEEAAARRAAESATLQLMESSNITMALLSALKDSLARTLPPLPPVEKG